MHDLITALFFVSLIVTPAMFAAIAGKERKEAEPVRVPETKSKAVPARREAAKNVRFSYAGTLPLHDTRALAGR